jgi:hypothetical protein
LNVTLVELQEKFIGEVLQAVDDPWDVVEVHYEYFVWKGNVMEQFTAKAQHRGAARSIDLPMAATDLLLEMRDAKPQGQAEHWTSVDFRLESDGKYKFDYGYGTPPMAAKRISLQPGRG